MVDQNKVALTVAVLETGDTQREKKVHRNIMRNFEKE